MDGPWVARKVWHRVLFLQAAHSLQLTFRRPGPSIGSVEAAAAIIRAKSGDILYA